MLLEAVSSMAQTWRVPERTIQALAEYGLVELVMSGEYLGRWTAAGQKFEDWCFREAWAPFAKLYKK
jgi:hypothetical protein